MIQTNGTPTTPDANRPHLLLFITAGTVNYAYACNSYAAALLLARRWYAASRATLALTDGLTVDEDSASPDHRTAMLAEISAWYASGEVGYAVEIVPLNALDPIAATLASLDRLDPETCAAHRTAIQSALAEVSEH